MTDMKKLENTKPLRIKETLFDTSLNVLFVVFILNNLYFLEKMDKNRKMCKVYSVGFVFNFV